MKRRPSGPKYRNLYSWRQSIWYERVVGGRRYKLDTGCTSWDEAARFRDLYEERRSITRRRALGQVPTFEEFARRYLEEDTAHLAARTRRDRRAYLKPDGILMPHFGHRRLDEITPAMLREWYSAEVLAPKPRRKRRGATDEPRPLSPQTGIHHVNTLAAIFAYAKDLDLVEESPVPVLREQLRRRSRSKRGRAEAVAGRSVSPIEDPGELGRLVGAAREEGLPACALVLLQLDAGLRLGEALGLRWGAVLWGEDQDDPRRALLIDQSLPSHGGGLQDTKSGRARRVDLSRRLWHALRALYEDHFEPGPAALVLEGLDPDNFRAREWRRICKQAGIGHRAMKDLRDTFASQLFSAGVQLGYVSRQLGHAEVTTTVRHYARWVGGDEYAEPVRPLPGELPADLLARIAPEKSPQSPHLAWSRVMALDDRRAQAIDTGEESGG